MAEEKPEAPRGKVEDPSREAPPEPPPEPRPSRAEPGLAERIRAKLKKLMDDDPNIYPLF